MLFFLTYKVAVLVGQNAVHVVGRCTLITCMVHVS